MFVIAIATDFNGYLVGMAVGGLAFGVYTAVDLALVVDVLPSGGGEAKNLGVFNIAGALPFSVGPALASAVLAMGSGSYATLYTVAGGSGILAAAAIIPIRQCR
jgi:MFS family permease